MTGALYYNYWEDWLLYHKVIFDGPNKMIYIAPTASAINVKEDLYSAWKEWLLVRENTKWEAALRTVGGDPTVGGAYLGATFFTINGWRIQLDHSVNITGNLFSDDFSTPYYTLPGTHLVLSQVSNLIDLVIPDLSAYGIPTADENADAVRTELTPELAAIETIPTDVRTELATELARIDADISSVAPAVWDEARSSHVSPGTMGELQENLANLDEAVSTVDGKVDTVDGKVDTLTTKIDLVATTQEIQRALLNENTVTDQHVYDDNDPPNLLSARIRAYNTRANAEAAGITGLLQTFLMTATYDSEGKLLTYKYVRVGS